MSEEEVERNIMSPKRAADEVKQPDFSADVAIVHASQLLYQQCVHSCAPSRTCIQVVAFIDAPCLLRPYRLRSDMSKLLTIDSFTRGRF